MIAVSAGAKELLKSIDENNTNSKQGLRLKEGQHGFVLQADNPATTDRVIALEGSTRLIVDGELEEMLDGASIYIEENPEGQCLAVCLPSPRITPDVAGGI
jgi:hypothetical protein